MTAQRLEVREGRPPTTIRGLERRVSWLRGRNLVLRQELRAQALENLRFADLVAEGADVIVNHGAIGNLDVVVDEAGRLGLAASHARTRLRAASL
jgi:hypothetical protein